MAVAAVYINGQVSEGPYISLQDAAICSRTTGAVVRMVVGSGNNAVSIKSDDVTDIDDLNPIPPGSPFSLVALFDPPLMPKDFLAAWQNIPYCSI
jgi:hypothetical protein